MTDQDTPVGIVKIEVDSRYLFVFHSERPLTRDAVDHVREAATKGITAWWEGGEKFGFIILDGGIKLHLERIEPEAKDG